LVPFDRRFEGIPIIETIGYADFKATKILKRPEIPTEHSILASPNKICVVMNRGGKFQVSGSLCVFGKQHYTIKFSLFCPEEAPFPGEQLKLESEPKPNFQLFKEFYRQASCGRSSVHACRVRGPRIFTKLERGAQFFRRD